MGLGQVHVSVAVPGQTGTETFNFELQDGKIRGGLVPGQSCSVRTMFMVVNASATVVGPSRKKDTFLLVEIAKQ